MSGEIMGAAPSARLDVTAVRRGDITAKRRFDDAAKRVLDVVVAATLLVVLLPLIVAVSMAIKAGSRGPVFFRCRRVGLGATGLKILKFRKMRDGVSGSPLTTSDDDRLTSVGRFLAKSKIDEIPQLWNVVQGDMSLVGPRPERPEFADTFARSISGYTLRHAARPGLTGLAQVSGEYSSEPEIKLRYDLAYLNNWSFFLDLAILLRTLPVVLTRRGI